MLEERDARIAVLEEREKIMVAALKWAVPLAWMALDSHRLERIKAGHTGPQFTYTNYKGEKWVGLTQSEYDEYRRAAAAYPTHSEVRSLTDEETEIMDRALRKSATYVGEIEQVSPLRSQAEANVLAVRSWDSPGFEACVKAEMEKMKAARTISPMQVQHANEAWNAQPADASEEDRMKAALETLSASPSPSALTETPIDMLLFCPACGKQHIDAPDGLSEHWRNPPHKSHLCHFCKTIWRPADVPTNGAAQLTTRGKADNWTASLTGHSAPALTEEGVTEEMVERATKAFMRFAGRDPDAEIAVYDCDVPTRLPAWELQMKAMRAALASALSPKGGT